MSDGSRFPVPAPHLIIAERDQREAGPAEPLICDVCGASFRGNPGGRGLLMWKRGDEVRFEEPVMCRRCAPAITAAGEAFLDGSGEEG